MLSPDLPFQQNRKRIEQAFPLDSGTLIIVVDAQTPEESSLAGIQLLEKLKPQTDRFVDVFIPTENEFFRKNALLFLEQADLDDLAKKLTDAQPFIGHLAQNYNLDGLFGIVSDALNNRGETLPMDLEPLLQAIDKTIVSETEGKPQYLSWQNLLAVNQLNSESNRTIVIAKPKLNFSEIMPAESAQTAAREAVKHIEKNYAGVNIRITGEIALEHEELESVGLGAIWSSLLSLILVCLALYIGMRSIKLMFSVLVVLILGLILTAGFATVSVGRLNIISIAFACLYIGLGVDYAIHVGMYYREGRVKRMDNKEAIRYSLRKNGFPLFLCSLTTLFGFIAFIPTDYAGVSELGIISGGGMIIGLLIALITLPAFMEILPVNNPKPIKSRWVPIWLALFPIRYAKSIRMVSILLAIASCFVLTRLTFDSNPINLRDPHSESVATITELLRSKTDSPFALTGLASSLDEANAKAAKFNKLNSVDDAITLSSFVPEDQENKLYALDDLNLILGGQLQNFKTALDPSDQRAALVKFNQALVRAIEEKSPNAPLTTLQQLQKDITGFIAKSDSSANPSEIFKTLEKHTLGLLPLTLERLKVSLTASEFGLDGIPGYVAKHWLSTDYLYKILITPAKDQNKLENLKEFVKEVQSVDDTVSGLPVADQASGDAVVRAFLEAFGGALIAIITLLLIMFRSLKKTALAIMPLLLAAVLTGAANVLLDNPFNFANIIALPLLLGMGIDSSIHVLERLNSHPAVDDTLLQSSTTRGVIFSAITTLCSFTSLAFTPHRGTASMGLLLAIGISFTLICALIVLPAFSVSRSPVKQHHS
jgi:hopanoid biosynthesis associated RND transporter like protein HpnN